MYRRRLFTGMNVDNNVESPLATASDAGQSTTGNPTRFTMERTSIIRRKVVSDTLYDSLPGRI